MCMLHVRVTRRRCQHLRFRLSLCTFCEIARASSDLAGPRSPEIGVAFRKLINSFSVRRASEIARAPAASVPSRVRRAWVSVTTACADRREPRPPCVVASPDTRAKLRTLSVCASSPSVSAARSARPRGRPSRASGVDRRPDPQIYFIRRCFLFLGFPNSEVSVDVHRFEIFIFFTWGLGVPTFHSDSIQRHTKLETARAQTVAKMCTQ